MEMRWGEAGGGQVTGAGMAGGVKLKEDSGGQE